MNEINNKIKVVKTKNKNDLDKFNAMEFKNFKEIKKIIF